MPPDALVGSEGAPFAHQHRHSEPGGGLGGAREDRNDAGIARQRHRLGIHHQVVAVGRVRPGGVLERRDRGGDADVAEVVVLAQYQPGGIGGPQRRHDLRVQRVDRSLLDLGQQRGEAVAELAVQGGVLEMGEQGELRGGVLEVGGDGLRGGLGELGEPCEDRAEQLRCLGARGGLVQHVVPDHGGVVAEALGEHRPHRHEAGADADAVGRGGVGPERVIGLLHGGGGQVRVRPQRGRCESLLGERRPGRGAVTVALGEQVLVAVQDHREARLVQHVQLLAEPPQMLLRVLARCRFDRGPQHAQAHAVQAELPQLRDVLGGPPPAERRRIGVGRALLDQVDAVQDALTTVLVDERGGVRGDPHARVSFDSGPLPRRSGVR